MAKAQGKPVRDVIVRVRESFYIGKRGLEITIRNAHGSRKLGTCKVNVGGITWTKGYGKKKTFKYSWKDLEKKK